MVETTIDGKKAYDLNPVRMLFDEISTLINEHSREELEGQLAALTEKQEELSTEYNADSLSAFREQLVDDDLSAERTRSAGIRTIHTGSWDRSIGR